MIPNFSKVNFTVSPFFSLNGVFTISLTFGSFLKTYVISAGHLSCGAGTSSLPFFKSAYISPKSVSSAENITSPSALGTGIAVYNKNSVVFSESFIMISSLSFTAILTSAHFVL